ncbi:hypothetical protein [Marimonas arenosa]|uniref:Uncharacterized protein n=1 Tax=Marimonas arenosa TaxID=1795305 RepID=A0AAE4B5V7_9RHOB|nr:hypothetical protein [Marimonas arenosa]MDQ2091745.1 hypothetical protein [Marimonas arenosa]
MAKLTKDMLFKADKPRAETLIDRTTRAARQILKDEAEQRELKTARLRKARLAKEADTPSTASQTTSKRGRK